MPQSHSDDSSSSTPNDSAYPALESPGEFKSQIPSYLLEGASESDRYLMEQMSIMRQLSDWSVKAHLSQDRQLRYTNGKVKRHESEIAELKDDKRSIVRGWRFIVAVACAGAGIISFLITVYQALSGAGGH